MAREQGSERLDENGVRDKVTSILDEVNAWQARLGAPWWPDEGSELRGDNAAAATATPSSTPTLYAWTSLAVGTECLLSASVYCLNFGPTVFSMHPLLRSALFGGAQAVWLLAPDDRDERLRRVADVTADSYYNHNMWATGLTGAHPDAIDTTQLDTIQKTLNTLAGDQKKPKVNQTRVIRWAAERVYNSPPDPQIVIDVLALWRSLSGVAHALPWEQNTRAGTTTGEVDGRRVSAHAASWTELQAAFGTAFAFLSVGWRLLDRRGAT